MYNSVINLQDYRFGKSFCRIIQSWDQQANDPNCSPKYRMLARKLAKVYREALEELCM